jgi:hypothetical protein
MPEGTPEFQVHSVAIDFDASTEDGGHFEIEINYLNRIQTSGSALPNNAGASP